MAAVALAGKDRSSSAGIILAKPTKQWVLPERAKPGRKPKSAAASKAPAAATAESKAKSSTQTVKGAVTSKAATTPSSTSHNTSDQPSPSSASPTAPPAADSSINSSTPAPTPTPASTALTNRDAQRQFRLRKSSYVASLEARVAAYERGELQRSVEIQASAVAVKEDNEALRRRVRVLEKEVERWRIEAMRARAYLQEMARGASGPGVLVGTRAGGRERRESAKQGAAGRRGCMEEPGPITPPGEAGQGSAPDLGPSSRDRRPSVTLLPATAPPSRAAPANPPAPATACAPLNPLASSSSGIDRRPNPSAPADTAGYLPHPPAALLACGFCTDLESACVCRMVAEADGKVEVVTPTAQPQASPLALDIAAHTAAGVRLDNLPPPEAAVPLPRRNRKRQLSSAADRPAQTWWVQPAAAAIKSEPEPRRFAMPVSLARCSGDPSDCDACRDDDFGRRFCERLNSTLCASSSGAQCAHCQAKAQGESETLPTPAQPTPRSPPTPLADLVAPCCGNGAICGSHPKDCFQADAFEPGTRSTLSLPSIADALQQAGETDGLEDMQEDDGRDLTMGADDAWRALKAHPNASFGSLDMLADVVARRSKCVGPRVELSPPPFEPGDNRQLVPLNELVTHRSKRKLEVQSSAVREALAILDAEPAKKQRTE